MKWLLYSLGGGGISEGAGPLTGVDGAWVSTCRAGDVEAVVSGHPGLPEPTRERALAFARVIHTLFEAGTVLPVRYGSFFSEELELDRLLRCHQATILEGLQRVAGCVELGVRLLAPVEKPPLRPGPGGLSGRAYLAQLRHFYQEQERCSDQARNLQKGFLAVLEGLYREHLADPPRRIEARTDERLEDRTLLSHFFLVPREEVSAFRAAFATAARAAEQAGARIMLSGPWPPYMFSPVLEDRVKIEQPGSL